MTDFFISYTRADLKWVKWIARQLEEASYDVVFQERDSRAGGNFLDWMDKKIKECKKVVAVLSPAYLAGEARFAKMERDAAVYLDKLLPIRVEEVKLEGLLGPIAYIDLVGLDEMKAKKKLLQEVNLEGKKLQVASEYPGNKNISVTKQERFPGLVPSIWNLPHLRNPNFTGREDVLNELHQALNSGQPAALTQAITGLGGIGKTQVALEYAFRYDSDYDIIWWVQAETPEVLAGDYAGLATKLDLPEKSQTEQALIITAVREWLEQHTDWLLIFDNAVDPGDLRDYIPRGNAKRILITSRHQEWGDLGRSIAVQTWPRQEAVDFLLKRTQQTDDEVAGKLAAALGDLPLALEQAAAYIKTSGISLQKYLSLFTERRKDLWKAERPPAAYHQDTVATTWSLAMKEVRETAPVGAEILNLCAFLAPENIPRSFFNQAAGYLPEALGEMFQDELDINAGIQALGHYSLIIIEPETLSIHRLVQAVAADKLSVDDKKSWVETAVKWCENDFPVGGYHDPRCWPKCVILLPHAQNILQYAERYQVFTKEMPALMAKIALYVHRLGVYPEAELLFRRALEITENTLGKDHPDMAKRFNNLAVLLYHQGNYADAENLYYKALAVDEVTLGKDHFVVAVRLSNLGNLHLSQNNYSKAESFYRQALEIMETKPEDDYSVMASCLENLANLLKIKGNYSEAESLYKQALEIIETKMDKDHPDMANNLHNLALLNITQGNYAEAEPLFRKAIKISEASLGEDHWEVAPLLNNLAGLLKDQSKYSEAEPLYRRALKILEAKLGSEHPNTIAGRNNLQGLLEAIKSSKKK